MPIITFTGYYGLHYHNICDHFFAVVFARISMSFQEKSFFLQSVYWKKCKLDPYDLVFHTTEQENRRKSRQDSLPSMYLTDLIEFISGVRTT